MSYGQAPFVSASRGALLKSFAVLFVFIVQTLVACLYTCTFSHANSLFLRRHLFQCCAYDHQDSLVMVRKISLVHNSA